MIFIRVFYLIFKRQILKCYYSEQSKSIGFSKMERAFVDSKGRVYFRSVRDLDMPIKRFKESQKLLQLMSSGLSEANIGLVLEAMKTAINSNRKPDLVEVGALIKELERRMGVFVDPDMLFSCAALMYVREDENPTEIDPAIHKEKIEQLKLDSQGGLYDFFYSTGLMPYIPFLGSTENEFEEYLRESEVKMKALQMHLERYTTAPALS